VNNILERYFVSDNSLWYVDDDAAAVHVTVLEDHQVSTIAAAVQAHNAELAGEPPPTDAIDPETVYTDLDIDAGAAHSPYGPIAVARFTFRRDDGFLIAHLAQPVSQFRDTRNQLVSGFREAINKTTHAQRGAL
jgi:hypothetical protein